MLDTRGKLQEMKIHRGTQAMFEALEENRKTNGSDKRKKYSDLEKLAIGST